jgi:hypothetical protein
MSLPKLRTIVALAAFLAAGAISAASAQTKATDNAPADNQDQSAGSAMMTDGMKPGTMSCHMMDRDAMPNGMAEGMPMMGSMHGHMMKIMFAIADSNGDGALSFDEVTAIHKRIFDMIDANKDGKVTPEEMQAFMRAQ